MQVLAGYPNVVLLTLLLLLTRAVAARRAEALAWLPVVGLLGALCGAVQFLPTLELVPHSGRDRALPWEVANDWRMRLEHIPLLFATDARGVPAVPHSVYPRLPWEWNCSVGRLSLLLLAVGVLLVPRARPWAALALIVPFFAAGGPVYYFLWRLPGFHRMQGPARLTPLWTTASCAVVALTVTRLRGDAALRRRVAPIAAAVLAVVLFAGLLGEVKPVPQHGVVSIWGDPSAWIAPLALFGTAVWLLARPPRRGFALALVLLSVADLWVVSGDYQPLAATDYWNERDPLTAEARSSGARVHASFTMHRELGSPHNLRYGVASTSILSPLLLRRTQRILEVLEQTALQIRGSASAAEVRTRAMLFWLRVGYVTADMLPEGAGHEPSDIIRVPGGVAPPAWVVGRWQAVESEEEAYRIVVGKPGIRPQAVVAIPGRSGFGAGKVERFIAPSPNRQAIGVSANGRPMLLVAENAYPGWRAYLDGRREGWYRADYIYRGVPLRSGVRIVRWVFDPLSVRLGLFLSLTCLGGLAGMLVAGVRR